MLDWLGDLAAGVLRLGRSAAAAAAALVVCAFFSWWAGLDTEWLDRRQKECPNCLTQAIAMHRVCSPGYFASDNPPSWSQPFGRVPSAITPKSEPAALLKELEYLEAKNFHGCKLRSSGLGLLFFWGLFFLMLLSVAFDAVRNRKRNDRH